MSFVGEKTGISAQMIKMLGKGGKKTEEEKVEGM